MNYDSAEKPLNQRLGLDLCLAGEAFIARCRALLEGQRTLEDVPRAERYAGRPALAELFADAPARDRNARNARVSRGCVEHGYTMKDIADFLGLHYTTISVILRQAEGRTL